MAPDLKSLLTPELFTLVLETRIPFSKTEPIDFGRAIQHFFFESEAEMQALRSAAWPALQALSELRGLSPDLLAFLPPVSSPSFPSQALGLLLLLDQASRVLLQGVDTRWVYGYFGELALALAQRFEALPPAQRPSARERWPGVALDYFVWVRLFFGAVLVHHESARDAAVAFTEETRALVEGRLGVRDPHRDRPDLRWDLLGFPKMLRAGGPASPCGVAEGCFWLMCLMDVHKPPLDKFGRYPYQNWRLGRVGTPEEDAWMAEAGMFGAPSDEVVKKIRQDVENGVWTPLGSGPE
ncbi:hypothetical protein F4810DRAFT_708645 [Camillea tinctor]|nr:hypothetical protein F4810DRAFT_708645 [Camillea tinctor]